MMMPGLSLSAEVSSQTNHLFEDNYTPFNNNPFAGENPTKIKRNLNVNNQYKFDFNHNNQHNKRVSYLKNDKIEYNTNTTTNLSSQQTEIRRYNTPLNNNNTENITVTYDMPSTMAFPKMGVLATSEIQNTPPSESNNYYGSGAPSTSVLNRGSIHLKLALPRK